MAYGRLDIFWPDGKFETHRLSADSVSVGRSSGNIVTLDTEAVSRYHFSITRHGGETQITDMDSANGTYLDGVKLVSNEPRQMQGGEEIQVGPIRMIYHAVDDQPTLPVAALADDTQRVQRESLDFHADIHGPDIAIPPGSHTSIELRITHTAETPRRYTVRTSGMPDGWVRVNRPELEIDEEDPENVLINIKPLRRSDSTPGDYTLHIVIAPKDEPDKSLEADVVVRILAYNGFGMALASYRLLNGDLFRLHMHNQGSADLPVAVSGRSPDGALTFGIGAPQMVIGPGQRSVLQGGIKPRGNRLFGATREHPFELIVRSRDKAAFLAAIPGTFVDRPFLPGWAALAISLIGLVIAGLIVVAGAILLSGTAPPPAILSFQADSDRIAQGDSLGLTWTVEDAEGFNILVDGTPVLSDLPPETDRVLIETGDYLGPIVISLEAEGEDDDASAAVTITVLERLQLDYFTVEPTVLVRNVIQNLDISWRVEGATSTTITGLDAYTTTIVETSFGEEGALLDVPGWTGDPLTITLTAQNDSGLTLTETLTVSVVNAECSPAGAVVSLLATPNAGANVVATVRAGTSLSMDRRDSSGTWVRAELTGGASGWAERTALACADNFSVDDLLIEATTPPPTPPPAQPTPLPSATPPGPQPTATP
jgi:hypothetical protein